MKIKKIILSWILGLSMLVGANSCDFLDANEYLHEVENLNDVWNNRKTIRQMWTACYTEMPDYFDMETAWPFNLNYDEGHAGDDSKPHSLFAQGKFDSYTSPIPNYWGNFYKGIRRCCIFIEDAHLAKDNLLAEGEVDGYVTDAKFFRAYYYSHLLELYGPFVIVNNSLDYSETDGYPTIRATLDECVKYIVDELNVCIGNLPTKDEVLLTELGRPTKTLAMAIKARVLLWYASPLVNGNPDYIDFVNEGGEPFFNATSPIKKRWEDAVVAYKALVDLGDFGTQDYKLLRLPKLTESDNGDYITVPLGDFVGNDVVWPNGPADTDPYQSYKALFAAGGDNDLYWNDEVIWQPFGGQQFLTRMGFPRTYRNLDQMWLAYRVNATQKMVDNYFLNNGKRIENDPSLYNDIGYSTASDNYYILGLGVSDKTPVHTDFSTNRNPVPTRVLNREARFYATIGFTGKGYEQAIRNREVMYADLRAFSGDGFNDGGGGSDNVCRTGYNITKWIHHEDRHELGSDEKQYPVIRFAEIYLSYAEALNESSPGHEDVLKYLNLIRYRAGLPGYASGTQNEIREYIKQERHVEFAFEGKRYFDSRRWKDAGISKLDSFGNSYGMHGSVWGCSFREELSEYFDRSIIDGYQFSHRNNFLPIPYVQVASHWGSLVQNPGW